MCAFSIVLIDSMTALSVLHLKYQQFKTVNCPPVSLHNDDITIAVHNLYHLDAHSIAKVDKNELISVPLTAFNVISLHIRLGKIKLVSVKNSAAFSNFQPNYQITQSNYPT